MHTSTGATMQLKPFNAAATRRQCGFSLIESLIGLAVTVLALGGSLPGLKASLERRHLDGAAAQLETDIQYARSLAVAQNRTLRISFRNDAGGSCYLVHSGNANACQCGADGLAVCTGGARAARAVRFENSGPVRMTSNVGSMVLEPSKGTVSPTGTIQLQGGAGHTVKVIVNIMGRARSCSPAPVLNGYAAC